MVLKTVKKVPQQLIWISNFDWLLYWFKIYDQDKYQLVLMMPQAQNYYSGHRRSNILQFFDGVPPNRDPLCFPLK